MLNEQKILGALGTALPLTCLDVTDSTNLRLKEMCRSGDRQVQLLCADSQTAGRGRLGRSFLSPENTGIYMSLLLPLPEDDLPLTVRAAAAVCRAVEEVTGQRLLIKWVNDLFLDGKKVCGILAEGVENMAVLGIGLNVRMPERGFPDVPIAGALNTHADREKLIGELSQWLQLLQQAILCRNGIKTASPLARQLSTQRGSAELLQAVRQLQKAIEYAQGNVSPAAICGYLVWNLR